MKFQHRRRIFMVGGRFFVVGGTCFPSAYFLPWLRLPKTFRRYHKTFHRSSYLYLQRNRNNSDRLSSKYRIKITVAPRNRTSRKPRILQVWTVSKAAPDAVCVYRSNKEIVSKQRHLILNGIELPSEIVWMSMEWFPELWRLIMWRSEFLAETACVPGVLKHSQSCTWSPLLVLYRSESLIQWQ